MRRSATVLAVPHQLQGRQFAGYVDDPSYSDLVVDLLGDVDFVFEEASGRSSIARELAEKQEKCCYVDVDPSAEERRKHGIAQKPCDSKPVGDDPLDRYEYCIVEEQRKREELWVRTISAQPFERSLVIVGLAHALSVAFRLSSVGIAIEETRSYIPHDKLCRHKRLGSQD